MSQNARKSIVIALRDQLRTNIDGTSGTYNNDLSNYHVKEYFVDPDQAPSGPFICFGAVSESLSRMDLNTDFESELEIELFGYVKSTSIESAVEQIYELLSDIETAILADPDIGDRIIGLQMAHEVGAMDELRMGICIITLSAKRDI